MSNELIYKREIIDTINKYLPTDDIIVLHGARQVGKTSILRYLEQTLLAQGLKTNYIDLEDYRFLRILDAGVQEFIKNLKEEGLYQDSLSSKNKLYIFIDEIQYLKNPSSFLKLIADHHKNIKLIVSGSSSFNIKNKFKDSLVGRTVNFEIYNLSFTEFLTFKNINFSGSGDYTGKKTDELISLFEEFVLFGGYPKVVLADDKEIKAKYLQQIIDTYVRKDIRDLAVIDNIDKFNRLLEVLASQSGQLINIRELSNTVDLAVATVERYLSILEETYIIRRVRPYSTNLRTEISKTAKIFFFDTGLAQMLWLKELPREILGQVFETCIFSELVKKYGVTNINYWRTIEKQEIDFILKNKNTVCPIEVKLNFSQFSTLAINSFLRKYKSNNYKLIALRGDKGVNNSYYPWEI